MQLNPNPLMHGLGTNTALPKTEASTGSTGTQGNQAYQTKARKASDEFEAFFVYQVLDLMQPDMSKDKTMGGGFGEDMFRHTLNEQVAKEVTKRGGFGISDMIYSELIKAQEGK